MQRPPTNGGRPPSQGMVPGTGMRSSYGGNQGGMGASIATNIEVQARPAVREGMKGMNVTGPGHMGPGRRVNDRSYYLVLFRRQTEEAREELEKRQEATTEIDKALLEYQGENVQVLWVVHFDPWMLLVGRDLYELYMIHFLVMLAGQTLPA